MNSDTTTVHSPELVVRGDITRSVVKTLAVFWAVYVFGVIVLINIVFGHEFPFSLADWIAFDGLGLLGFTYFAWLGNAPVALEVRLTDEGIAATNRSFLPGRTGSKRFLRWDELVNLIYEGGTGFLTPKEVFRGINLSQDQLRAIIQYPKFSLWNQVTPAMVTELGLKVPPSVPLGPPTTWS